MAVSERRRVEEREVKSRDATHNLTILVPWILQMPHSIERQSRCPDPFDLNDQRSEREESVSESSPSSNRTRLFFNSP